jgi:hypothetical protein
MTGVRDSVAAKKVKNLMPPGGLENGAPLARPPDMRQRPAPVPANVRPLVERSSSAILPPKRKAAPVRSARLMRDASRLLAPERRRCCLTAPEATTALRQRT